MSDLNSLKRELSQLEIQLSNNEAAGQMSNYGTDTPDILIDHATRDKIAQVKKQIENLENPNVADYENPFGGRRKRKTRKSRKTRRSRKSRKTRKTRRYRK